MTDDKHRLPPLTPVAGLRLGTARAGIKKADRDDLVVVEAAPGSTAAGVFTRNAFCAAPVTIARRHMMAADTRYLLINTGNANAGTGATGEADALACCAALAKLTGVASPQVLPFSTGVIGEPLPTTRLAAALPMALDDLSSAGWERAAGGILTTDTRPKGASRTVELAGQTVVITGIAKGAGMIRPDMATMLAFIATDAPVSAAVLDTLLRRAIRYSFNRVTIDGDTSTNDACVLLATGQAAIPVIDSIDDPRCTVLQAALSDLALELAQAMVRDGEGATKFVSITIRGGASESECEDVAYTLAHSPLVKTALFASDPNWGRILAAIGRAGIEQLDIGGVSVQLNGVLIATAGARADTYTEEQGAAAMQAEDIELLVDLGRGAAEATVWTSDLSYDYVRINAEYRT